MNKICEILGIKFPIIQGGMAWVSDAVLAAAVSNAGGLGVVGAGAMSPEVLREEIRKAKSLTDKPFGVNLIANSQASHFQERMEVVLGEKPPIVTLGALDRVSVIPDCKEAGIKVLPVVSIVAMARRCEQAGADAIIAEGSEAGGHIGETTTMILTPLIADAVSIPVIAAGGIANGRGMAAAFALGAEGVQIGTRFVCAAECTVHPAVKDKFVRAGDRATVVTGREINLPVRAIKNNLTKEYDQLVSNATVEKLQTLESGKLRLAMQEGDVKNGSAMAGQCVAFVNEVKPAAEIIRGIHKECSDILAGSALFRL